MPYSAEEGKRWVVDTVGGIYPAPTSVLDVGPGSGTYAKLLRPVLPAARFDAVEVHEPYVEEFGLADLYDQVTVADIRDWSWAQPYDLVVLGDVLEHLTFVQAVRVWNAARRTSRSLVVSLPTSQRWWHQDAEHGNAHEAHRSFWTHALFGTLPGVVDSFHGTDVSVFLGQGGRWELADG